MDYAGLELEFDLISTSYIFEGRLDSEFRI